MGQSASVNLALSLALRAFLDFLDRLCAYGTMTSNISAQESQSLKFAPFDAVKRRKRISIFKVGKLWLFKYFFEDKETFKALVDYYNEDQYRFEFKSLGTRKTSSSILSS